MKSVGLVLAAGQSRRFGEGDKLLAPFRGRPLAGWVAEAMRGVPLDHRMVVAGSVDVALLFGGYEVVAPAGPDAGQALSLAAGVARAMELGADRLLIALADMPFVRHGIMTEVLAASSQSHASAVTDGVRRMPPACFPFGFLPRLACLEGDRGAGRLLQDVPEKGLVPVPEAMLADIDSLGDFERLDPS